MDQELQRGLDLMRRGEFFAAHEELETAWRVAPAEERDFYQGLVHVAVAWYQAERVNRPGCHRQLEKAARRLHTYRPTHRGVDVESLLEQVAGARKLVTSGSLDLPHLDLAQPNPLERPVQQDTQPPVSMEEEH